MTTSIEKTIWFIRHPQTDWNAENRLQSRSDRPLSAQGIAEAKNVVNFLAACEVFDQLYVSPRSHCLELGHALHSGGVAPTLTVDARLGEIDHGIWEGLTAQEISRDFPLALEQRWAQPTTCTLHNGETLADASSRYTSFFTEVLAATAPRRLLVVCHKTPIQLFLTYALKAPIETFWQFSIATASCSGITQFGDSLLLLDFVNRLAGENGST